MIKVCFGDSTILHTLKQKLFSTEQQNHDLVNSISDLIKNCNQILAKLVP